MPMPIPTQRAFLIKALSQLLILLTFNSCQTPTPAEKAPETAPNPGTTGVESPASTCDELLGSICPEGKVSPHTCITMNETSEKPDGKFEIMGITECHARRIMAAEICKADLVPAAANIRCKPPLLDKRTIDCAAVMQTMCSQKHAPASCIGVLERPKLPTVHLAVDGSNHCTTEIDLQKKICALASIEKKTATNALKVSNWKIACAHKKTNAVP